MSEQIEIPDIPRRVRRLTLVNFKRCRDADILFPDEGKAWVLGGPNESGKSSICDGPAWIMGGAKLAPGEPITRGADEACGVLELGDDVVITRRAVRRDDGSVRSELTFEFQGEVVGSPQTLCDALAGRKSTAAMVFDPSEFFSFDSKKRAEMVRQLIGLDFSDLDRDEEAAVEDRKEAGREVARLEGAIATLPKDQVEPVDIATLTAAYTEAIEARRAHDRLFVEKNALESKIEDGEERIRELEAELAKARAQLIFDTEALAAKMEAFASLPEPADLEAINRQMREAVEHNERAAKAAQRKELERELTKAKARHKAAEQKVKDLRETRQSRIEQAEFPTPGMTLIDGELYFHGLPLEENQLSQSQLMRIALDMRIAANPNFQFAVLKNAAFFDRRALEDLDEYARETGFFLLLERPDTDTAITRWIVEDGVCQEVPA